MLQQTDYPSHQRLEDSLRIIRNRFLVRDAWLLYQNTFWVAATIALGFQFLGRITPIPSLMIGTIARRRHLKEGQLLILLTY